MTAQSEQHFAGRTAIVTGASRGIGLAVAQRLVDRGANVVITARDRANVEAAVASLGEERAIGVVGSADDVEHQATAIAAAIDRFGRLDFLVNNAGINPLYGPLIQADLSAARKIVDVNAIGALSWIQQAHRAWMAEHGGVIVNMASVAGVRPSHGIAMYGSSKAMLTHITQALAVELGPGIRVNGVAPGVVKTDFAQPLYVGREDQVAANYPAGRLGEPEDIANAVEFLLSDRSSWITGQLLVVDGGVTLGAIE